ncbi:MAG: FAD-dependent oxidoreductase [Planctomycetales bacterium]|nr:FAD-dependent oxidoreductase [Planctomycetales bacterium]MCA9169863.1 FAD-dependent oxidoreductase [Planctomycetales bacterium]
MGELPADRFDVAIVGAGLAGLTAALKLRDDGLSVCVLEEAEDVGGRLQTEERAGFLLDRGFQVFLTSYPEPRQWLDFPKLQLMRFVPGALVRKDGQFHRFADPWRRPSALWSLLRSPVGTFADKLKIARMRRRVCRSTTEALYETPDHTTIQALRGQGLSESIIESFFRPFLGGVFLDHELTTSSRLCDFVFRHFALGDATLPSQGMQAIPRQLADKLSPEQLHLATPVGRLTDEGVMLADGRRVESRITLVATNAVSAQAMLPKCDFEKRQRSVACLYFAADRPPVEEPILILNGEGRGPVNNMCVPSQVAPTYAPPGSSLISVTVLATSSKHLVSLEREVRDQLKLWFGGDVLRWEHLKTDWIPEALPRQAAPALTPVVKPPQVSDRVFVCGDHRHTASIQGAMESGRLAAQAITQKLRISVAS